MLCGSNWMNEPLLPQISGVSLMNVGKMNLLTLAPGGHVGRFCIWTESAISKVHSKLSRAWHWVLRQYVHTIGSIAWLWFQRHYVWWWIKQIQKSSPTWRSLLTRFTTYLTHNKHHVFGLYVIKRLSSRFLAGCLIWNLELAFINENQLQSTPTSFIKQWPYKITS